jgi:phage-related protein
MADNFGLKIGVEGEKEFKNSLRDINQSFKVLGSEMKLVSSEFDKNDKNITAVSAKNAVLNKSIDAQKEKIATLESALKNATESFGENDKRTQNWAIQLNNAKAQLNGMTHELEEATEDTDDFGEEIKETAEETEKSGSKFEKFAGVLKGIGVTVGAVAIAAGAAAIKLGKEVVSQFGELEQNLGGSEAVFQNYANHMQKIGEDAYKTMGVSQSQYLATANKMGALFQGSGVDVQKSAELTEKSMQRAADMASVMGIDMQVALDSVAGAAKGNFTMMDNLGVSMNATNIEAYALAKGLDFTWKTASQAEKAEVAMQMFFENTEQYAGNFEREATQTVSGSIGLLQAALGSFTAGLGNADADMQNLTGNMVAAFQAVIKNIVPVIENIVKALPQAINAILTAVSDLLPTLLTTVTTLFKSVLETLLALLPKLIPVAVDAVLMIVKTLIENLPLIIDAAFQLVTTLVSGLAEALPQLIPTAVMAVITIVNGLIENLPLILDADLQLILGLAEGLITAIPMLVESLPVIITALVEFLINSIPLIIDTGIQLLTALVTALPTIIEAIVVAIPVIIENIITAIIGSIPQLIDAGIQLLVALIGALPQIITTIANAIPQIIEAITGTLVNNIDKIIMAGVQLLVALVQNMPQIISAIVSAIPQIINGLVTAFDSYISTMGTIGFNLISGVWNGISNAGDWLRSKISGFFGGDVDNIKDFFGIHSPSTLFRDQIGKNMALGIGVGFDGEMDKISKEMQEAIPTEFDVPNFDIKTGIHTAVDSMGATVSLADLAVKMDAISEMFPLLLKALDLKVVLDDGTLVGRLTPGIDKALAQLKKRNLAW